MKKTTLCAVIAATALVAAAKKQADPVLMNVAGKNVPLSEFEYLYNKNNTQQLEPLSPDRYLQMFVDYKLKVADAEAAGLDTTAAFRTEYLQYRDELAKPYMRDESALDSLVAEAYSHYGRTVRVSHIMLPQGAASRQALDSLRADIKAGRISFEQAAMQRSIDKPSAMRGGAMGNVLPGRFPWAFEKAAYDTPEGEISAPVNSGFGWHLVRVDAVSPSEGEVHAAHILRLTRGLDAEGAAREHAVIDSLHAVAAAGGDFADLARRFSQDPGSGARGGDLGWFGRGMMVQPFDSIAFALPDGGLSEPFLTDFGWHIIYKNESRKERSLEELRPEIEKAMSRDDRSTAPERAFARRAVAERGGAPVAATVAALRAAIAAAADGTALDSLLASPALASLQAYRLRPAGATLADVAPRLAGVLVAEADRASAVEAAEAAIESAMQEAALDDARATLMATNTDYRNLMNEYRDGILLFEIANSKVWERAGKDTEGLEAFFEANRDKYAWDAPRFKSYVVFAATDSLVQEAVAFAAAVDAADPSAFVEAMRARFGRDVRVERVLAAKGENPVTDYLAFGGERPEPKSKQWACYAAVGGRVINAPESVADVRAAAVADYQAALEAEWLKELHARYKVKINKKTLKKIGG